MIVFLVKVRSKRKLEALSNAVSIIPFIHMYLFVPRIRHKVRGEKYNKICILVYERKNMGIFFQEDKVFV